MKIEREQNRLLIDVPQKGSEDRSAFLSELSGILFAGWKGSNVVVYDTQTFSLRSTEQHVKRLIVVAERRGYDISQEVYDLFTEIVQKCDVERELEKMIEENKRAREIAMTKIKIGCCSCVHLSWDGQKYVCAANGKPCDVDPYEAEQNFEEWKLTKVYKRLTPFPNKECQYLEVLKG